MKAMHFDLKMYGALVKMAMRSLMQYRADFWTSLVGVVVLNGANLVQMGVVAWKFDALGAWTEQGFGQLLPDAAMRIVIPSATCILLGMPAVGVPAPPPAVPGCG